MDYSINKEVYMPSTSSGRQVKVTIKEVYKHTAACNACRTRKRKCDGKAPCSYCVGKNQPCEFTQQRKRGPPRKHTSPDANSVVVEYVAPKALSMKDAIVENYMSDLIEAKSFVDYYWSYIKHRIPGEAAQLILNPQTNADKIQAYAVLAFASRISGDATRASTYINQARSLAGTVFDTPEPKSIEALVMMNHYWQLVLDIPLARHYTQVSLALSRMTPLKGKLALFCRVGLIMSDNAGAPPKLLASLVKQEMHKTNPVNDHGRPFLIAALDLRTVLGFNAAVQKFLHVIDDVVISEDDRALVANSLNLAKVHGAVCAQTIGDILFFEMFYSLYMAVVEWKSGYPQQALVHAKTCLVGIKQMSSFKQIGIASDFPHICMLGALCKLFYQQGESNAAVEMCQFIRDICKIMQPAYNFVDTLIDDFLEMNIKDSSCSSPDSATYLSSSPSSSASSPQTLFPSSPPSSPVHYLTLLSSLPSPLPTSLSLPLPSSPSLLPSAYLNQPQQTFVTSPLAPPIYSSTHTFYPQNSTPQNSTPQNSNIQLPYDQTTNFQPTNLHTQNNIDDELFNILNDQSSTQTTNFYSQNSNNQTTNFYTENFNFQTTNLYTENSNVQTTETAESSAYIDSILNSTSFNTTFDVPLIDL